MRLAVFGLGKFGRQVALELGRSGHDVLAMDENEDRVQAVREFVSRAVVGDCTDRQTLEDLGAADSDAAVVSLGANMAASILLTLYLKELGVGRVLVKALDNDHAAVLTKVGADEIIFPEREMARRLAVSLASPNVIDYLPLSPEWAIAEIAPGREMIGRSLRELDVRRKWGIQVLAVKDGDAFKAIIDPDRPLRPSEALVVMGRAKDIDRMREAVS